MQIVLNGQVREIESPMSVAGLLASLADDPRGVAVERNLEIVPKAEHADTFLEEGDRLELVRFVGGG